MAKRVFKVYIEVDEEILQKGFDKESIHEQLKHKFLRLKPNGIDVKYVIEENGCEVEDITFPLYIDVEDGEVTNIWYVNHWGLDGLLSRDQFSVSYESH